MSQRGIVVSRAKGKGSPGALGARVVGLVVGLVALAATAVAPVSSVPVGAAFQSTFSRLTTGSYGVIGGPLISRDGEWVAFTRDVAGRRGEPVHLVLVRTNGSGSITVATAAEGEQVTLIGLSDDGGEVLYLGPDGYRVFRRSSGSAVNIDPTNKAREVMLSGDGETVFIASFGPLLPSEVEQRFNLYARAVSSGTLTRLTNNQSASGGILSPSSSTPDGRIVTFFSTYNLTAGPPPWGYNLFAYLLDRTTGSLSIVGDNGSLISPSGRYLALSTSLLGGGSDVRLLDRQLGRSKSLYNGPRNLGVSSFVDGEQRVVISEGSLAFGPPTYSFMDTTTRAETPGPRLVTNFTYYASISGDGLTWVMPAEDGAVPGDADGFTDVIIGRGVEVEDPPTGAAGSPTVKQAGRSWAEVTAAAVSGSATPITGYRVFAYKGSSTTPVAQLDVSAADRTVTFNGLEGGTRYRFRAAALNSGGAGPLSPYSAWALPPFSTLDRFTDKQYSDFTGRLATAAEKSDWRTRIGDGSLSPEGAVAIVTESDHWRKHYPVIRLFRSYFLRLPDYDGLNYWTRRLREGTSLSTVSQGFAASAEFKTRYGSLTNRAFVDLVYRNVLGRAGDASGVGYWTSQLDQGKKTRGQVMLQFSESSENITKSNALVNTVSIFVGMLRRMPAKTEVAQWAPATSPPSRAELIRTVLRSEEYDRRA